MKKIIAFMLLFAAVFLSVNIAFAQDALGGGTSGGSVDPFALS